MPHVASKASVLKSQHSGLSQRERMPETRESTSPFSTLLAETGSAAASARPHSARADGSTASQRNDNHVQRGDPPRPQRPDENPATDAPEAVTTEAAATEQPDGAATDQSEIAAAGQTAVIPELSTQTADSTGDAADDEVIAIDAALAAVVETPSSPEQPVVTDTPSLAAAVTPAAAAPAETDTIEPAATAPAGVIAAVTPDAVGGATKPAPPPAPQTPQAPDQTAHPAAAPAMPLAKPSVEPTATPESANQPQPSTTPDTATAVAPVAGSEHAETKSASQQPAHAETPRPSARPNGPGATERPPAASEFVQAAQPTPDSSHLAHLQTGRDFVQAVAATADASQSADTSNALVSAPVPLESLAVEIATRAQGGRNRFEIRLDPPELGRIDVRLDIDRNGNVTSRLVVEKAETLDVLRRDAHQLERALQDAGLKTSDNSLQFSLRDQSLANRNDRNDSNNPRILVADPELPAAEAAPVAYGLTLRGGRGIDIRV